MMGFGHEGEKGVTVFAPLGLPNDQDVGIFFAKEVQKIFLEDGSDAVDVPGDDFHVTMIGQKGFWG